MVQSIRETGQKGGTDSVGGGRRGGVETARVKSIRGERGGGVHMNCP